MIYLPKTMGLCQLSLSDHVYVEFVGCLGGYEGERDDRSYIINTSCLGYVQTSCSKGSEEEEYILPSGIWIVGTEQGVLNRALMYQ